MGVQSSTLSHHEVSLSLCLLPYSLSLECCLTLTLSSNSSRPSIARCMTLLQRKGWYGVFLRNLAEVEAHNSKEGSSYSRGINEWSDLTQTEWSDIYLGGYKHIATHSPAREESEVPSVEDLPASKDWRDEG